MQRLARARADDAERSGVSPAAVWSCPPVTERACPRRSSRPAVTGVSRRRGELEPAGSGRLPRGHVGAGRTEREVGPAEETPRAAERRVRDRPPRGSAVGSATKRRVGQRPPPWPRGNGVRRVAAPSHITSSSRRVGDLRRANGVPGSVAGVRSPAPSASRRPWLPERQVERAHSRAPVARSVSLVSPGTGARELGPTPAGSARRAWYVRPCERGGPGQGR